MLISNLYYYGNNIVTSTASRGSGMNDEKFIVQRSSCCLKERLICFFTAYWAAHRDCWKTVSQCSLANGKSSYKYVKEIKKYVCAKRGTEGHLSRKLRQDSGDPQGLFFLYMNENKSKTAVAAPQSKMVDQVTMYHESQHK